MGRQNLNMIRLKLIYLGFSYVRKAPLEAKIKERNTR